MSTGAGRPVLDGYVLKYFAGEIEQEYVFTAVVVLF